MSADFVTHVLTSSNPKRSPAAMSLPPDAGACASTGLDSTSASDATHATHHVLFVVMTASRCEHRLTLSDGQVRRRQRRAESGERYAQAVLLPTLSARPARMGRGPSRGALERAAATARAVERHP